MNIKCKIDENYDLKYLQNKHWHLEKHKQPVKAPVKKLAIKT